MHQRSTNGSSSSSLTRSNSSGGKWSQVDNTMDSVGSALKAVVPGASSFEDIEKYVEEQKKRKKEEMRGKFAKPKPW